MPRKPKNKEITPPEPPKPEPAEAPEVIPPGEKDINFEAVEGFLEEMQKLVTREDLRALLGAKGKDKSINELKVASKIFAALKIVAEKAAREEVRNYAAEAVEQWEHGEHGEAKPAEQAEEGKAEIEEDSPPLELNGKRIIPRIEVKPYHGLDRLKISTSKPAQKIRHATSSTDGDIKLPVVVLPNKPRVYVSVNIPDDLLKVSHRITHYERAVEDAIGTLWAEDRKAVTDRTVFLAMNGLPADTAVSQESIDKVHKAIDRLSRTRGEIVFPREVAEAFKFSPELSEAFSFEKDKNGEIVKWTLKGPIVQTDEVTATFESNGRKAKAWTLTGRPPLFFLCSKLLGQVRTIPSKCMNVKYLTASGEEKTRQNTENFIAMKHYLAIQVKRIEAKKDDDIKRILLKSLIEEIEELNPAKREQNPRPMTYADKKRIVEDVTVILEWFKRINFIEDYKPKKEGREITGFDIEPRKRKRR